MAATRRASTVTAIIAAVLITGLGIGSWWAWGKDHPLEHTGPPLDGPDGRSPADPMTIAELGGAKENYERIHSIDGVRGIDMLTDEELDVYQQHDPGRAKVGVTNLDDTKASVLLVQLPDHAAASDTADELSELQRTYGFADTASPDGVRAGLVDDSSEDAEPGGRAHYVHDDIVVRIEARGTDAAHARATFDDVLAEQTRGVAPDE